MMRSVDDIVSICFILFEENVFQLTSSVSADNARMIDFLPSRVVDRCILERCNDDGNICINSSSHHHESLIKSFEQKYRRNAHFVLNSLGNATDSDR